MPGLAVSRAFQCLIDRGLDLSDIASNRAALA